VSSRYESGGGASWVLRKESVRRADPAHLLTSGGRGARLNPVRPSDDKEKKGRPVSKLYLPGGQGTHATRHGPSVWPCRANPITNPG